MKAAWLLSVCLLSASSATVRAGSGDPHEHRSHPRRHTGTIWDSVLKRHVADIQTRQTTSSTIQNFTTAGWDTDTEAACTTAIQAFNGRAQNPSGVAVCYNVQYLDTTTGRFDADLRLYAIESPTGEFATAVNGMVNVSLSYVGARILKDAQDLTITRRAERGSLWAEESKSIKRAPMQAMITRQVQGQIDSDLLPNINGTIEQKLLVPVVTLASTLSNGSIVNTTLSSAQSNFVNGVFAKQAAAAVAVADTASTPLQTLVVGPGETFVLPGVKILVFPVGAIITGIWTLLFIGTVAYGTYGRKQFRDSYRRRRAVVEKVSARMA